ncbi:MAG: hypothetical protein QG588_2167, partial [Candidatus Poribacteria bacterium]|nr:hypothetical protein [Candidatus Poribacteria bacterium]
MSHIARINVSGRNINELASSFEAILDRK